MSDISQTHKARPLHRIGQAIMLPLALLPVAGILWGVGASLVNAAGLDADHVSWLAPGTVLYASLTVIAGIGAAIFKNLPLIFAVGVALGLAEDEKGTAVLSGAVAYLVMHGTIGMLLSVSGRLTDGTLPAGATADVLGFTTLDMGIFGGIITGLGVASLHNRFRESRPPKSLGFFGGIRSVPVVSSAAFALAGILVFFVWPFISTAAFALGDLVVKSGYAGTMIFGFLERLLLPFGLSRAFSLPFLQSGTGGLAFIDGTLIYGTQNIFLAEFRSPSISVIAPNATRFMSGRYPVMLFGLPGAALALYSSAVPEKRRAVGGLYLLSALSSLFAGVSEPLEYTFLFAAPALYLFHCIFTGAAYMIMQLTRVGVGTTFSGGLFDLLFYGVTEGNARTGWVMIPVIGAFYFLIYFFFFRWIVKRFNPPVPGQENDGIGYFYRHPGKKHAADVSGESESETSRENSGITADHATQSEFAAEVGVITKTVPELITEGFGGRNNIESFVCAGDDLIIKVKDPDIVLEPTLHQSGAEEIIRSENEFRLRYGTGTPAVSDSLAGYLGNV